MTPKLRFKGFTDDWEQRKFSDLFKERKEKTKNENEDILLSCAINGMFLNSELFGHFRGSSTVGYLKVKKNDLILSAQNLHLGNANVNARFDSGIISPAYKVYEIIESTPEFTQAWVKQDKTKQFFLSATTEGASQCRKNIEWNILYEQKISVPSMCEQRKIGIFFSDLDNLINLYQRELDQMKVLKKGMLQKMFPKDGETVPEIRFSEFSGAWEQRKVRDIANRYNNLRVPVAANLRVSGTTPYYGANGIQDYVEGYTHEGEFVLVAEDGANDLKNYPVKCVNGRIWVNNHAHVLQGKPEIADNQFLAYSINQADIESLLVGGGRAKLNAETLMDIELTLPSLEEQRTIGLYLKRLDHLITLHQRECDTLKRIKKGFLQQMFV